MGARCEPANAGVPDARRFCAWRGGNAGGMNLFLFKLDRHIHTHEGIMLRRMLLMLAVVIVIVGGLGFVKFKQIEAATQNFKNFQPPPTAVTTIVARQEQWPGTLNAIGTVVAVQGVTVSADLPGIVDR